ncbi:MAG: PAS domain-containing protein [Rubrivivax sp.]|nr:PAS domain-containing protein [Rubrivivax sp.]
MSVADAQGGIVYVNRKFCELSGYTAEELIGINHRLLKSGLHGADFYEEMWHCIAGGRTWRGEICNRRKTGELYWVQATITPELDGAGLPCRYVSIRTDISATKRAQRRAEVAEERYCRSQDFAEVGTWDLDLRTHELHWSERIGPLFGHPVGELKTSYENFIAAVHPDDRQAVMAAVDRGIETGAPYEIEHRCVWPDGTVRWLLERGDVTRGPQGEALRMLGVVQDITVRKEAQAQLALFRQVVESTSEGVALCSAATHRLIYLNPAARAILGVPAEAAVCADFLDLVPAQAKAGLRQAVEQARRGQGARLDFAFQRPDGKEVPLRNSITPVLDDQGAVSHLVNVFGDRSEEIERQREFQLALDEARRANRAKADFMSRMSHELRTPLNAVLGFSQVLLLGQNLDAAQTDGLREILKAGSHLLELVDEVLDIARIDLGTLRVSLQPVHLGELIHQAMALVTPLAHERGISFRHDIDAAIVVAADPLRLKQCVINLLSNAVKYNRSGGSVQLRASPQGGGRIRIEVEDSGVGIAAAEMEQLFEPFTRLERHRGSVHGIGIGLSITQRLVTLMNGEIGVHSRQGVGSVFWIELERAEPRQGIPAGARGLAGLEPRHAARRAPRKQVLYVEDNPANLKLVRAMLRLLPTVAVLAASTAAEGMALARDERPDLILLDIGLPGMSGLELLAWLRREPALAGIPVIAISANAMPADVERGLVAGFDDYLTKPIDVHKLLDRVQAALALQGGES